MIVTPDNAQQLNCGMSDIGKEIMVKYDLGDGLYQVGVCIFAIGVQPLPTDKFWPRRPWK